MLFYEYDMGSQGCIGETVSAALAAASRDAATEPEVKAALTRITSDEARHSLLAWRTARWALSKGDNEVRAAVEAVLNDPERAAPGVQVSAAGMRGEPHGRLSEQTQRRVIDNAMKQMVQPCAQVLFGEGVDDEDQVAEFERIMMAALA